MSQAPEFSLPHVSGGRPVSLSDFRGTPVVLVVSGKGAADDARNIGESLGNRYVGRAQIVSVVDTSNVPRLVRPVAKKMVEKGFKDAVDGITEARRKAGLPISADPTEVAVFVRDDDGQVAKSYALGDVENEVAAILVGPDGELVVTGRGPQAGAEVEQALG